MAGGYRSEPDRRVAFEGISGQGSTEDRNKAGEPSLRVPGPDSGGGSGEIFSASVALRPPTVAAWAVWGTLEDCPRLWDSIAESLARDPNPQCPLHTRRSG